MKDVEIIHTIPESAFAEYYDLIDIQDSNKNSRIVEALLHRQPEHHEVLVNANSIFFDLLNTKKECLTRLFELTEWSEKNLFGSVYNSLFKKTVNFLWTNEYMNFLEFRDRSKLLIGAHIRCGGWEGWRDPLLDIPANGALLAKAVRNYAKKNNLKEYQVYLASDNTDAKKCFCQEFGDRKNIFSQKAAAVHVDRSENPEWLQIENIFVDHFCLSQSDVIVHGFGNFAKTAAMISGVSLIDYNTFSSRWSRKRFQLKAKIFPSRYM
jgi:hypothetical protein